MTISSSMCIPCMHVFLLVSREPIKVNKGQKSKQKQTKGKPSASTAAMTQAAMKNKTIQRELRKSKIHRIISYQGGWDMIIQVRSLLPLSLWSMYFVGPRTSLKQGTL